MERPRWARSASSRQRRVHSFYGISIVAVILLTAYKIFYLQADDTSPSQEELLARCPQVEPLFPNQNPALSRMEAYLDSKRFRKETIIRMTGAVQIPSVSYDGMKPVGQDPRWDIFYDFAAYLERAFPLIHSNLILEKVNTHGLLYTWDGSDASLKPTVLMAHQDVVPVDETTIDQWTHPPFSGAYDGTYVWGRGSSDAKNPLIGTMEAVELLIEAKFKPKRSIILSFGFDEESAGTEGAGYLANFLLGRYGKDGVAAIVDEGAGVMEYWGALFAMPAVAEKGYLDVEIIIRMPGGHSSAPPDHNGIGIMSEFITMVEGNLYEPHIYGENPFLSMLQCGAAYGPDFPQDWKPLLSSGKRDKLARKIATLGGFIKYLFTTSVAVDIIGGGVKANALPERTTALINHRINVGDHVSDVQDHLTRLANKIGMKYNLTVHAFNDKQETPSSITLADTLKSALEPAPVTPTNIDGVTPYGILSGTTRALYGKEVLMTPGIMTGNTDTK
jgi:Gly-Xaa carboxypeptidase